ncbi:MAG: hypothetical protein B7X86_06590 [Sphingobacteriales bacterium 17-39-43]|uniref:hypothetical protein n=1 Tax=Daejeonella sp. TaxID=2805397 RepID=UPI000BD8747D|nr:hypothetical protein [Daejeonella sp.]OYZ31661.1 MAG: hypothetical protein B7Y24_07405 [Sphingobacteriales bacterium 16-39-50]OYZ58558.1 MAG: hypothetical protein B7Y19_01910 [Sphingobacteriales bacterium 24-40-4]OZA25056.1 MAG: hypothetical protein B7X86_06590 [Sphingobacteriales bacterium 17-39-43]OZA59489.1 MAG: hypothetical protein B7X75_04045 [Sphingobacteriales bacterium 39-40-5]HQS04923.1 hypothetical protein [Daejeonella sp.]
MKKLLTLFLVVLLAKQGFAQIDPDLLRAPDRDSARIKLNMDAVYDRPFLQVAKLPVALGGYAEANYQYLGADGLTEGHQFQMRRFTLFVSSGIAKRIKFLSELEFEDGTKEINIEFASIDFEFNPLLNLRGGIVMNPIGAFNQNHDGPKWEFVDRPISATQMLPATWSNVGFGIFGKKYLKNWVYAYEAYLTNGFDETIIANSENRTFLPASKANRDRFEESFNGAPLLTGKVALRNTKIGELGLSYMGGIYNKFQDDGLVLDEKRRLNVFAIDFNTVLPKLNTFINVEWAWVNVDVPATYTEQFGSNQQGGFIDIVQPLIKRPLFGFERAVLNAAVRLEYVDWNKGKFSSTSGNISDHIYSVVPALSFRPTPQTVIRLNYRYNWQTDLLGNPAAKLAGFQFGVSTYF